VDDGSGQPKRKSREKPKGNWIYGERAQPSEQHLKERLIN
jgi:hypothetical protein